MLRGGIKRKGERGYQDGNPLLVHVTSDNGQPAASSAHDRGPGTRPIRRVNDLRARRSGVASGVFDPGHLDNVQSRLRPATGPAFFGEIEP